MIKIKDDKHKKLDIKNPMSLEEYVKEILKDQIEIGNCLVRNRNFLYIQGSFSEIGQKAETMKDALIKDELVEAILKLDILKDVTSILADNIILSTRSACKSMAYFRNTEKAQQKQLKQQEELQQRKLLANKKYTTELNILKEELSDEQKERMGKVFGITFEETNDKKSSKKKI